MEQQLDRFYHPHYGANTVDVPQMWREVKDVEDIPSQALSVILSGAQVVVADRRE
jgi:hypothetical protein